MREPLIGNLFLLFLQLALPILGAVFIGGILGSLLQRALRIEDRSIGFAFKFAGFVGVLFLSSNFMGQVCAEFATRVWGASTTYGGT